MSCMGKLIMTSYFLPTTVVEIIPLDYIQCIWKVFRPLNFFHILLYYSVILKNKKNPHQSTHNNPKQIF